MLKVLKYLKPYWLSVTAVVLLIFAQAQAELALPDYMSDIVTYGIQYGGITESMPEALSEDTYEHMQYFMDEDDVQILKDSYQKADTMTVDNRSYSVKDAYVLKDNVNQDKVQKAVEIPFLTVHFLSSEEAQKQLTKMGITDVSQVWDLLKLQPQMASEIDNQVSKQLDNFTSENKEAAEIMMLKNEYASIGADTEGMQNSYILHEGILMLGIALISALCALSAAYLASKVATGTARDLRSDVFKKVESFSNEEFSKFSTASLITRTTNDIQQIQMVLTLMLRVMLFAPFMGFTALFKVIRYPSLAGILGWTVAGMIALMIVVFAIALPKFKTSQKLVDRLNLVTREQLDGMLVIRAFNNEKTEEKTFDGVNKDITNLNIFLNRLMSVVTPVMTFLMSGVSILIIWIGAKQVDIGMMQVGDMMAFLQYATHVLISFMIVAAIFIMIPRASVSANRVMEVINTKPSITDPVHPVKLPQQNEPITFDHVSFHYPHAEKNVLEDISFTAEPGQTIAFIGSTGSGKSTLVNLVPRFFDVSSGSIKIGDTDIRDVTMHDLRDHIGYIPQKGTLFSGTIESNLKYADENATEETIENALEVSQAKEFVDKLPNGIEEPISEGGTNVSGGQRQRLSIARALTKKANLYIFDDTFSALDYATDAKLREALSKMIEKTKSTVFIVAQRISTIMHADKIIVLDDGKIAGMGTHEELMKNCEVYQEIAHSQLSSKELGEYE